MAAGFLCFLLLSYLSVTLLLKNSPLLCPTLQPSSREILREGKPGREGNRLRITREKIAVVSLRKTRPGLSLKGGGEREIWNIRAYLENCAGSSFQIPPAFRQPLKAQMY